MEAARTNFVSGDLVKGEDEKDDADLDCRKAEDKTPAGDTESD